MADLTTNLKTHYDCDGTGNLIASVTFPDVPTADTITERAGGVPEVAGKFGNCRGDCSGAYGGADQGFASTLTAGGPWDFRNGTRSFSIGCWVNLSSAALDQIIFEHAGGVENTRGWALRMVHQYGAGFTGPVLFIRDNVAANWNVGVSAVTAGPGVAGGQATAEWVYVGISYNTTTKLFGIYYSSPTDGEHYNTYDATAMNGGAGPFNGWTAQDVMCIGINRNAAGSVGSAGLEGKIDHLDIWWEDHSLADWQQLYNSGAGLVASNAGYGGGQKHEIDDVDYESGEFRTTNYAATIAMRADSISDHPYSRLTLMTQDYTSDDFSKYPRDWSARYIRNYYTIPPANFWAWYRCTGQRDGDEPYVLEDAVRYFIRIYKQNQDHWLQGPMLVADTSDANLVPVAYVPTGVTKQADVVSWSDICLFDNFTLKVRWNPINTHMDWNQTTEMFRIANGADWIKLEVLGSKTPEREYNLNDTYGPHEPLWRFSKGNGTTTEFSQTFILYHSYGGTGSSNEWMINDIMEFEIINYAGQLSSCRVKKGGVEGYVSSNDPTAIGASAKGSFTLYGPGVWSAPTICNVRNQTRETTNPKRDMLANRIGVPRRMTGAGRDPILNGERDPNTGIINPVYSNSYLEPDDFNRANDPNLGGDWWTEERTGAGWTIASNKADCAELGWERWDNTPKHRDHIIRAKVTASDVASEVGIFGRYERYRDGHTCYLARLVDAGATANLEVMRYWEGTGVQLAVDALDKYTTTTEYEIYMKFTGTAIYAQLDTLPVTAWTADGIEYTYTAYTVVDVPITPGRAYLTWTSGIDGLEYSIVDDGSGNFNAPGSPPYGTLDSGTIDYATGALAVVFTTPPPNLSLIKVHQRLALVNTTDTFLPKPGRMGIYGYTTGAGNSVQIDDFSAERNHNVGVN
jgi:hypothetical protein